MRKLLATLTILAAVVLLLPFGFGLHTHYLLNKLDGLRIPLQEGTLGALEVNVEHIERGWFHSRASLTLLYEEPSRATLEPHANTAEAKAKATTLLSTKLKITHGPVIWRSNNDDMKHLPSFLGQAWIEAPIDYAAENFKNSPLEIVGLKNTQAYGWVSLLGQQKIWITTSGFSLRNAQSQLTLADFDLVIERSPLENRLSTDLYIPQLNFVIEENVANLVVGMKLQMDYLEMEFNGIIKTLDELWFGTWVGSANLTADYLQLNINKQQLSIDNLSSANLQEMSDNGLLAGEGEVDMAALDFNDEKLGPIEVLYSYANIDKNAVEYMRGAYNEWLYSNNKQTFLDSLSPEQKEAFFKQLFQFVNNLPSYKINEIDVITPKGNFIADFDINITDKAADITALQSHDYWKQNIHAALNVLVAETLMQESLAWGVGKFYSWINPLITQPEENVAEPKNYDREAANLLAQAITFGILQQKDNELTAAINYDKGVLTVNEKTYLDLSK